MAATIPAAAAAEMEAVAERHVLLIGMAVLAAILFCAGDRCARSVMQSVLALAARIIAMTVPRQDDHQTPGRIAGLSLQGLARGGGEAWLATINRLAAEMRPAWGATRKPTSRPRSPVSMTR